MSERWDKRTYLATICPECGRQLFGNTVWCPGSYVDRHPRKRGVDVEVMLADHVFPERRVEIREAGTADQKKRETNSQSVASPTPNAEEGNG